MESKCIYISDKTKTMFDEYAVSLGEEAKRGYWYVVKGFCEKCKKDYIDADLKDFREYFDALETAYYSGNTTQKTIYKKYSMLNGFCSFILANGRTFGVQSYTNYMSKIERPSLSIVVKPQSIPTLEEIDAIYGVASGNIENYAIIALVNKCSLTTDQICTLTIKNLICDTENRYGIFYPHPTRADRFIKLPEDILVILDDYVKYRESIVKPNVDAFFLNQQGNPLTQRVLEKRVKSIMEKAGAALGRGAPLKFSLQDIRNFSVVLMLAGGAEPVEVAEYVGINPKWMPRYNRAVDQFIVSACDFNFINIKRLKNQNN